MKRHQYVQIFCHLYLITYIARCTKCMQFAAEMYSYRLTSMNKRCNTRSRVQLMSHGTRVLYTQTRYKSNNGVFRVPKTQFSIFYIIYRSACTSYNLVRSSHLSTLSNSDLHYCNNQPTKCTQIVCSFYYSKLLSAVHGMNNINFELTYIVINSSIHFGIYTTTIRILQRDYAGNDSNCCP